MPNWLERPSSLNWANKKKLGDQILRFQENISDSKLNLTSLLSLVNDWEVLCKELLGKSEKQELTARNVLQLRPLLDQSERFSKELQNLCAEKLTFLANDENDHLSI